MRHVGEECSGIDGIGKGGCGQVVETEIGGMGLGVEGIVGSSGFVEAGGYVDECTCVIVYALSFEIWLIWLGFIALIVC